MAANSDQKGSFWNAATPSLGTYKVACSMGNTAGNISKAMIFDGSVWNKIISFRFSHSSNAHAPIDVTEFGMLMHVSPLHLLNAQSPISVTELGMLMLVSADS